MLITFGGWVKNALFFSLSQEKKRLHISGTFNFFDLLIISREVGWVGECRDSACPRYHFFVAFDLILLDFFFATHIQKLVGYTIMDLNFSN